MLLEWPGDQSTWIGRYGHPCDSDRNRQAPQTKYYIYFEGMRQEDNLNLTVDERGYCAESGTLSL